MTQPSISVNVRIEVPRYGFIKRESGRGIEYISPLPCPFNYGCVPTQLGADGDPADAIVLGPRLAVGTEGWFRVFGTVQFLDAGVADPKLVCGLLPPTRADERLLTQFFTVYAYARRWMNRARGLAGETRFDRVDIHTRPRTQPEVVRVGNEARVSSTTTLAEAHLIRDSLARAGLHPRLVGELRPSYVGEIPIPDARIEVRVPVEQALDALGILGDLEDALALPAWSCHACGEENPGTFSSCWKCQGVRHRSS